MGSEMCIRDSIIDPSVTLEGHWELLDREWIQENYVSGDLRDGIGLLNWIENMYDQTPEQGQITIQNAIKQITIDTRTSQMQLLKSLLDLLSLWKRIGSNKESDPVKLDDFYLLLLSKLPTAPIEAPIVRLRSWFAEKHFEKASFLTNVRLTIERLCEFGSKLGVPVGSRSDTERIVQGVS